MIKKRNLLILINVFFFAAYSDAQYAPTTRFCGKIPIQTPLFSQNSTGSSPLKRMILCKSQKLYFRTTLGLFPVSSIDCTSKLLTISHHSCSSSLHYVSPSLLLAGFPSPPQPNSLLLFNCSNKRHDLVSPLIRNCTQFHSCGSASSRAQEQENGGPSSCLLIDDLGKLDKAFHPKDLNCSHYSRVYRNSSEAEDHGKGYELGTRISFDVPDHVPNICDECEKPNGDCGVGLRCICHPKDCKDKVVSECSSINPSSNVLFSLLSFIVVMVFFVDY